VEGYAVLLSEAWLWWSMLGKVATWGFAREHEGLLDLRGALHQAFPWGQRSGVGAGRPPAASSFGAKENGRMRLEVAMASSLHRPGLGFRSNFNSGQGIFI
jgi:hypothetical protein